MPRESSTWMFSKTMSPCHPCVLTKQCMGDTQRLQQSGGPALKNIAFLFFFSTGIFAQDFNLYPPGFRVDAIEVPLDWNRPIDSQKIKITFKVYHPYDESKPFLFFVGGGPGSESIESYDRHFSSGSQSQLSSRFRVVVFDQRGLGQSSHLKKEDVLKYSPKDLRQFFSTSSHIYDLQKLIGALWDQGTPFYLGGHSYGGEVVLRYMEKFGGQISPEGIILVGGLPPSVGMQELFDGRIAQQIYLANEVLGANLEWRELTSLARAKVNRIATSNPGSGLSPTALDNFFYYIDPDYISSFMMIVKKVLEPERKTPLQVLDALGPGIDFDDPLANALDWTFSDSKSQESLSGKSS